MFYSRFERGDANVLPQASTTHRSWLFVGLAAGLLVIIVGTLMLTVWEVHLFRATTRSMDFTGLVCGTPFDNPGWVRDEPCDGAVNRQLAASVVIVGFGLLMAAGSSVLLAVNRAYRRSRSGF